MIQYAQAMSCLQFGALWWEIADSRQGSAMITMSPTSQPELTC